MSFDPVDFYKFAGELYLQNSNTFPESCTRTTISRAYYGAFIAARDKTNIQSSSSQIHKDVCSHYSTKKNTLQLANQLSDLRVLRNDADYEMEKRFTTLDSSKALKLAGSIINKLQNI